MITRYPGCKSHNKVSTGEPSDGSLINLKCMSAQEDEIIFLTKACQLELALFHRHVFALY